MAWTVELDDAAVKALKKLDKQTQKKIIQYQRQRIETEDTTFIGLVVDIGHRKKSIFDLIQ